MLFKQLLHQYGILPVTSAHHESTMIVAKSKKLLDACSLILVYFTNIIKASRKLRCCFVGCDLKHRNEEIN